MRILSVGLALAAVVLLAGCGNKGQQTSSTENTGTTETTPAPSGSSTGTDAQSANWTAPPDLDKGPRAAETPVNAELAAKGAKVFQARGCATCHAFGKKVIGPDLKPVAKQRTQKWMEAQILHPDKMTQQDPIAKQLLSQYKTQMTNQGLSADEAKQVIEYIKQQGK